MTPAEEDLAAFISARWPVLVRVALALGAPPGLAVEVATDAVGRLGREWRRLRSQGDPDSEAVSLVVAAWDDVRRTPWWERHPVEPAGPWAGLESLDRLAPGERAAVVVARLGELGELGGPGGDLSADPVPAEAWAAARTAPVLDPPPTAVAVRSGQRSRRSRVRRRLAPRALAGALALGLLAGAGWWVTREEPADPSVLAAAAVREGAPSWLTWWADGQLHLAGGAALAVSEVEQVVAVDGGEEQPAAVYVDAQGRVVHAGADGARRVVGHTDSSSSLVVSADGALVAWADDTDRGSRRLVVATSYSLRRDVARGRRVLRLDPDDDARPVAVADDLVWATSAAGDFTWSFVRGETTRDLGRPGLALAAVAGDRAAFVNGDRGVVGLAEVSPGGEVAPVASWPVVPGREVVLSPDGVWAVTLEGDGTARLVDATSGKEVGSGVPAGFVVLSAELGADGRVAYVVARADDRPDSGDYVRSSFTGAISVLTCRLPRPEGDAGTTCASLAQVSGTVGSPLLAR